MNDKRDIFQLVRGRQTTAAPVGLARSDIYHIADRIDELIIAIDRLARTIASTRTRDDAQ